VRPPEEVAGGAFRRRPAPTFGVVPSLPPCARCTHAVIVIEHREPSETLHLRPSGRKRARTFADADRPLRRLPDSAGRSDLEFEHGACCACEPVGGEGYSPASFRARGWDDGAAGVRRVRQGPIDSRTHGRNRPAQLRRVFRCRALHPRRCGVLDRLDHEARPCPAALPERLVAGPLPERQLRSQRLAAVGHTGPRTRADSRSTLSGKRAPSGGQRRAARSTTAFCQSRTSACQLEGPDREQGRGSADRVRAPVPHRRRETTRSRLTSPPQSWEHEVLNGARTRPRARPVAPPPESAPGAQKAHSDCYASDRRARTDVDLRSAIESR
jgi:hypothetical protein